MLMCRLEDFFFQAKKIGRFWWFELIFLGIGEGPSEFEIPTQVR